MLLRLIAWSRTACLLKFGFESELNYSQAVLLLGIQKEERAQFISLSLLL
nr:DUF3102 domain-containing protein [Desulfosporosinus sp. HMP52]